MKSEIKKKAAALTAAGILSLSCVLTAGVPSHAEAGGLGLGDVGTIIQAGAYYAQAKAQLKAHITRGRRRPFGSVFSSRKGTTSKVGLNSGLILQTIRTTRHGAIPMRKSWKSTAASMWRCRMGKSA